MDAETATIVSRLGHALVALAQHEQASANLQRAFAYYADVGVVSSAVATVEYPHNQTLLMLMKDTLAQALDLVPAGSLQSARLLCSYGQSVGLRGNGYEKGMEALEESLAIARERGGYIPGDARYGRLRKRRWDAHEMAAEPEEKSASP